MNCSFPSLLYFLIFYKLVVSFKIEKKFFLRPKKLKNKKKFLPKRH